MHRSIVRMSMLAVAAMLACTTEPGAPVLTGSWGGPGLGLTATSTAASLVFGCSWATTGALRAEPTGVYTASGQYTCSFACGSSTIYVDARAAADTLLVTTYLPSANRAPVAYRVVRDAAPVVNTLCPQ
jgi:hypothetical protein